MHSSYASSNGSPATQLVDFYRASEEMGQLYMRADEFEIESITTLLNNPICNASSNKLTFDALLEELKLVRNRYT